MRSSGTWFLVALWSRRAANIRRVVRRRALRLALAISMAIVATTTAQDCDRDWAPGASVPGVHGVVYAMTSLENDDIVIAGNFTIAGDVATDHLVRYRPSTGEWTTLGSGISRAGSNPWVSAIATRPDGDLVIAGRFDAVDGVPARNIARYDASAERWSPIGGGLDGEIKAVAWLADGDVLAGGYIPRVGGAEANGIARYYALADEWSVPARGLVSASQVYAFSVLPDGDVLVGGDFWTEVAPRSACLARYRPLTDDWDPVQTRTPIVRSFAALPDGGIVLGAVHLDDTRSYFRVMKYDPDTRLITAVGDQLRKGDPTPTIVTVASRSNGDVFIGGFLNVPDEGRLAHGVLRYEAASGRWRNMGSGLNVGSFVYAILPLPTGVLVGGDIASAGGAIVRSVAAWSSESDAWTAVDSGTDGGVGGMAELPNGDVLAGGSFRSIDGVRADRLVRYRPTCNAWYPVGAGANNFVQDVAPLPDGQFVVAGRFTQIGGIAANKIARYDPASESWTTLGSGLGSGLGQDVYAVTVMANGDLIAGGAFTSADGVTLNRIARYDATTRRWSPLGAGLDSVVYAIEELPSGDIIVGGSFSTAGGVPANRIARYNPASDSWSAFGTGVGGPGSLVVYALQTTATGDVLVGGTFRSAGGIESRGLALLHPAIGAWSGLGGGVDGSVRTFASLPDGAYLIGGSFTRAGGISANSLVRYDPSGGGGGGGAWTAFGEGLRGSVVAVTSLSNGDILAGGGILTAGGRVSMGFARWVCDRPECIADANGDGTVDFVDYADFVSCFESGDAGGCTRCGPDFNADGFVDFFDYDAFVAAFEAGC